MRKIVNRNQFYLLILYLSNLFRNKRFILLCEKYTLCCTERLHCPGMPRVGQHGSSKYPLLLCELIVECQDRPNYLLKLTGLFQFLLKVVHSTYKYLIKCVNGILVSPSNQGQQRQAHRQSNTQQLHFFLIIVMTNYCLRHHLFSFLNTFINLTKMTRLNNNLETKKKLIVAFSKKICNLI